MALKVSGMQADASRVSAVSSAVRKTRDLQVRTFEAVTNSLMSGWARKASKSTRSSSRSRNGFMFSGLSCVGAQMRVMKSTSMKLGSRSEEHTSELQSHSDLVCRLLLEKKKRTYNNAAE